MVDDLQENSVCTEHRPTIINEPRAALSKQKMSFQKLRVNSIQFSLVSATQERDESTAMLRNSLKTSNLPSMNNRIFMRNDTLQPMT